MNALRIIGYITAAILIFFGVLFIWGAGGEGGGGGNWIFTGVVSVLIGFGVIWLASRKPASGQAGGETVLKIDLPGQTKIEAIKCNSCGGTLSAKDITLVNGAPMVNCPYCHTVYQLTEEPKW